MTTVEKMFHIKKLMDDVEAEVRETAKSIENINFPLYRMLTEGCADSFKEMSKALHSQTSGYPIEHWEKQLNHAYKISK
jgi:hypothetical protein